MRKIRKKYKRPKKPWDSTRLEEEKGLVKEYGLRTKRELWRSQEMLRQFRGRARGLISAEDPKEQRILLDKLIKLGMLSPEAGLDDVLALEIKSILERRLQTIVLKRKLATTPFQARQMITHGHIMVSGKRIKYPSYMVMSEEEAGIKSRGEWK